MAHTSIKERKKNTQNKEEEEDLPRMLCYGKMMKENRVNYL